MGSQIWLQIKKILANDYIHFRIDGIQISAIGKINYDSHPKQTDISRYKHNWFSVTEKWTILTVV